MQNTLPPSFSGATPIVPNVVQASAIVRQGQILAAVQMAQWVDNLVLSPGATWTYIPPSGQSQTVGPPPTSNPVRATLFRITLNPNVVVYVSSQTGASKPAANNLTGNGSIIIGGTVNPYLFQIPFSWEVLYFFADPLNTVPAIMSIECWW